MIIHKKTIVTETLTLAADEKKIENTNKNVFKMVFVMCFLLMKSAIKIGLTENGRISIKAKSTNEPKIDRMNI
jgi:hypothetical protein